MSVVSGPRVVEWRFVAPLELLVHVFLDQMHRNVARAFVHHLHTVFPGALGEFALHLEFGKLRLIVGVAIEPGRRPSPMLEAHVVGGHDFADFVPMRVGEIFLVMRETPLGQMLPPRLTMPVMRRAVMGMKRSIRRRGR